MAMELPKNYDFKEQEKQWQDYWEKKGIFSFDPESDAEVYSIDTPPPYISGKMHIGHAFGYSQQDFIARFRRMFGYNVFYPFGTDDNGLPTERFVEKTNNVKSANMPRAQFIDLCIKTLKDTTWGFVQDWKDIGISSDFSRYYSTIDKPTQKISQSSFIELCKLGHIYEKEFPSIWCCECQTAIAQAELEDKELDSLFSTLRFSAEGKDLLIATTRPELLPACVAVFVNPADERYTHLIGKKAMVPLFNFEVPILADESAQLDKGTGVLMVCSYGDKYDAAAIAKHKLEPRVILTKEGILNSGLYRGLRIKAARKKILEDLKNSDLIFEQIPIKHSVNVHDKCGTEIEIIPTAQWFIRILDKKDQLIEQGRKIKWYPEFMIKRYENWILGLEWDWNISRNRHFGIPIPVWKCPKCGGIILAEESELPVDPLQRRKRCVSCDVEAKGEDKVLDTWATSSLTPQIASSLSSGKAKLPFSLRPQGHDIIRTWAFYTIVKAYLHDKEIPWKDITISGNVSLGGDKMSKSKGNIIEPKTVLDKYGADCLRYWAAGSKLGEDLDYMEKDLVTGQKFVTKLWNAGKFAIMHLEDYDNTIDMEELEAIDIWLLSKMNKMVKEATESFMAYEYSRTRAVVEQFFWKDLCDNYLEIVKDRLYNPQNRGVQSRKAAQYALYNAMLTCIKMMAPITPYITESVYHLYFNKFEGKRSIHICKWPIYNAELVDDEIEKAGEIAVEIVSNVRKEKNSKGKSLKTPLKRLCIRKEYEHLLLDFIDDIKAATSAQDIEFGDNEIIELE